MRKSHTDQREFLLRTLQCTDSPAVAGLQSAAVTLKALLRSDWSDGQIPASDWSADTGQPTPAESLEDNSMSSPRSRRRLRRTQLLATHSLVENLKMLFFFAKIKFAILPSFSMAKVQSCCSVVADKNFDLQNMLSHAG